MIMPPAAGDPASLACAPARRRPRRIEPADLQRAHDGAALSDAAIGINAHRLVAWGCDGTRPVDRGALRPCVVWAARRTREIGIRMAIGADRGAGALMVLRQGIVLAVVGLVLGLIASVGAGELLRAAFPSGDDQRDGGALLIVVPIVLAVTFLAAYVPARRASRVNPMQALRQD